MEIKNCPFCGSLGFVSHERIMIGHGEFVGFSCVFCSNSSCGIHGPIASEIQFPLVSLRDANAVHLWNSRVTDKEAK